jgi:glycosyltransferase involved in cell wall biosynthesis
MPSIAIVMPCYNAVETLPEALESIAAQSMGDYQLIVVDDGSSDGSLDLLRQYAGADARIQVQTNPHGGVIAAANAGLQVAAQTGAAYIARMDADDRMHPHRLELQLQLLSANPGISVASCRVAGFGRVREGFRLYCEWLNSCVSVDEIAREMFVESVIPNPTVLFRRALLETVGYFEERGWPEDYDYWLRAHLVGVQFAKVPQVLHEWREHPRRLTRTDSRYSLENFIRAKAHYLVRGPLLGREEVIIWGAGMMGKRISKHLIRAGAPVTAFLDIDPDKIGRTRRGKPVYAAEKLPGLWKEARNPVVLAAVGARGARALIREHLAQYGLIEGYDWWGVA